MGSSDELVAKLRGGSAGNYDVISPSSDVATSIATAGLAAPLDLAKLPSYAALMPALTSLPLVKNGGKVYGVPYQWGPNPLLYDTTRFKKPLRVGVCCGIRVKVAKSPFGTIFQLSTWRHKCLATIRPDPVRSTISLTISLLR